MQCEICGKDTRLYRVRIEGTVLNVCKECSAYGKVLANPVIKTKTKQRPMEPKEEVQEQIVPGFGELIRKKREQLGLQQREFARLINEKESLVHKMETGSFTPSIGLAKKLQRFLKIKLVELVKEEASGAVKGGSKSAGFTLGDAIKLKK